MRSPRSRILVGTVTACLLAVVTACSGTGGGDDDGPPRISPGPRHDVAAEMIADPVDPAQRLDACGLLDLTAEQVIDLTGAEMPDVQPTGQGEVGIPCTFGGPGSPERLWAELEAAESTTGATTTTGTETTTGSTTTTEPTTTEPTSTPPAPPEDIPVADTVAAGVVKPRVGAEAALAGQPALLSPRLACSPVQDSAAAASAPATAPGYSYLDCTAAPTGGGVEVHTIFVADADVWHLTFVRPGTPRSPADEAEAIAGLHRMAEYVLS